MNECECKKGCQSNPCGCPEPVFSVEAMPDDPTVLRFNVNGKSVWYDFSSLVKAAETPTALHANLVARALDYNAEGGDNTVTAKELGSILHLSDIGDVDANSVDNFGILNYRANSDCPEGCDGANNVWRADNPIDVAASSLSYVLGSDADGKLTSLMPPTDTAKFSLLTWAGANKAMWKTPTVAATPPLDADGKAWRLYVDPSTNELIIVKEEV